MGRSDAEVTLTVGSMDGVHGNTLARQIRSALAERILSGELPPGTRLKDNEVATLFGTSNTPVREALRELAKDGLVEMQPYRGCVVRSMDAAEAAELYEVRQSLEELAARRAATLLTDQQLERLEALADEYERSFAAGDRARSMEVGLAFHRLIVEASGNRTLFRIFEDLARRSQIPHRVGRARLRAAAEPTHQALVAALRARAGRRAGALMARHLADTKKRILEAMREGMGVAGSGAAPPESQPQGPGGVRPESQPQGPGAHELA